jgi:hypothetical protein
VTILGHSGGCKIILTYLELYGDSRLRAIVFSDDSPCHLRDGIFRHRDLGRRQSRPMPESATAMSRTKKPSKLSAETEPEIVALYLALGIGERDERAFLNRIRSLNEEETEKLTFEELIAYLNIMHKIQHPCRWPARLKTTARDSWIVG